MLKFLSSMLCTFRIHAFSLGNYLGTSLIIGNLMIIRVRVASYLVYVALYSTWVIYYHQYLDAKLHASLLSSFLLENSLYFDVDEIITFQKLIIGNLDKMTIANLGGQHQRYLDSYFKSS